MKNAFTFALLFILVIPGNAFAKRDTAAQIINNRGVYLSNAADGFVFSSAVLHHTGGEYINAPLRITGLNAGVLANYNYLPWTGLFAGAEIKNIGFAETSRSKVIKRRVYSIGLPAGLKFGTMTVNGTYGVIGGGADLPFNYKEKTKYSLNEPKQKLNEWNSSRTPPVMPFVFIGYKFPWQLNLKATYYLSNFFNPDYVDASNNKPYKNYSVNVVYISAGFTLFYGRHFTPDYPRYRRHLNHVHRYR